METLTNYIFESREIKNKKFIKMLDDAGFKGVSLEDDSGTVYLHDEEGIASNMYENAWYGIHFKEQSLENWIIDIALKYFEECEPDEIHKSKNIHPKFDVLYSICSKIKETDYYKEKLDNYKKDYEDL